MPRRTPAPRLLDSPYGPIPMVWVRTLYHLGERPSVTPPRRYDSHEGDALSVVRAYEMLDDWAIIARSSGAEWRLNRETPAALVNAHALRRRKTTMAALLREALTRGWLEHATITLREYQDDERGQIMHETLTSPEEIAAYEAEGETLVRRPEYEATTPMVEWWHERFTGPLALGRSAMSPAEAAVDRLLRETPALHGQWWQDDYDPEQYSCPRGGLWSSRLEGAGWTCTQLMF